MVTSILAKNQTGRASVNSENLENVDLKKLDIVGANNCEGRHYKFP